MTNVRLEPKRLRFLGESAKDGALLPQNNANHAAPMKATMKRRQSGFSMIEILVVMGIGMILIAMAVPLVSTTLNMYRLRGAGGDYANLLPNPRIPAVTKAKHYQAFASA